MTQAKRESLVNEKKKKQQKTIIKQPENVTKQ